MEIKAAVKAIPYSIPFPGLESGINTEPKAFVVLFKPKISVIKITTIIKIFRNAGLVLFPVISLLLITMKRKILTNK